MIVCRRCENPIHYCFCAHNISNKSQNLNVSEGHIEKSAEMHGVPKLGNQSPELGDKGQDVELGELAFTEADAEKLLEGEENELLALAINRILAEKLSRLPILERTCDGWFSPTQPRPSALVTARGRILLEPIAKAPDTAEGLLRELCEIGAANYASDDVTGVFRRARALLAKGGE